MTVLIRFDGGTPCNSPRLGYGIGYGSFTVDKGRPVRINHDLRMSANAAELFTMLAAVESLSVNPEETDLVLLGDSRIALKWAKLTHRKDPPAPKKGSDLFRTAIASLAVVMPRFKTVTTIWTPRAQSVAVFGH